MTSPRTRTPLWLLATALMAVTALVAAGCGGDDADDTTTTTTEAETTDDGSETGSEDAAGDTTTTLVDSELCRLAAESEPDLSTLPDLMPEELRDEAAQFAQEYTAWADAGDQSVAPPTPSEGIINYITEECFPDLEPPTLESVPTEEGEG